MPLDPVDIAEMATTGMALHDRLSFRNAVYLRRATAEGAPNQVANPLRDVLDEESFVSVYIACGCE